MAESFLIIGDDDQSYFGGDLRGYLESVTGVVELTGGRRDDFLIIDWSDPEAYFDGVHSGFDVVVPPAPPPTINTRLRYVRTTRRGRSF